MLHARIDAVYVPTAPKRSDSSEKEVGHRGWTTRVVPSHPLQQQSQLNPLKGWDK
jgi:hypothetical protein